MTKDEAIELAEMVEAAAEDDDFCRFLLFVSEWYWIAVHEERLADFQGILADAAQAWAALKEECPHTLQ